MELFWKKVAKSDGCWLWTGCINKKTGYGEFHLNKEHMTAHRASWIIEHGPIPFGYWVLHSCDVRRCVRPDHLFLGTAKTNTQDMIRKGRKGVAMGEGLPQAKLTKDKVKEIRSMYPAVLQRQLSERFGVSQTTVSDVVNRKVWKHI